MAYKKLKNNELTDVAHKLSLSLEEDDDELIATVYGIISDLPDYRLWLLSLTRNWGLDCKQKYRMTEKLYHKAGVIY